MIPTPPYPTPHPSHTDTDLDSEEMLQDADEEAEGELAPGKQTMRVVFQPTFGGCHTLLRMWRFLLLRQLVDTTHTIYYRGHWLRVRRSKKTDGSETEMLSIRCGTNHQCLFIPTSDSLTASSPARTQS